MKIPRHILAQTIAEKTLRGNDPKVLAQEIAAYLITANREHELESLIRDVMAYRQERGVLEAEVISAHDVESDVLAQVKQLLHGKFPAAKQIILRGSRDGHVVGGLDIKLAHQQLDMSVRARLDTFSRLTTKGNA